MKKFKVTVSDLQEMDDSYSGLCLNCGEWRWGDTEPDAQKYPCESCGMDKVYGPVWLPYAVKVEIEE